MFLTIKKWTVLYILCFVLLFAGFAFILWQGSAVQASRAIALEGESPTLIIDPGHGGEDGGAVAEDGTVESQINLEIGLQMEEIARLIGVKTEMTRREDVSIYDEGCETLREKKVSDLKNRVALINSIQGGVLISIHQNTLPGHPSVCGAQVFYNQIAESDQLSLAIQEALNLQINGAHAKVSKQIDDSIYLMKNVTVPAVLIECGFLSNPQETAQLREADYQLRLALVILSASLERLSSEG